MSALFLILLGIGIILFACCYKPTPKHPPLAFTANLRRGEIETRITASYREGDTEFVFEAERVIREWAADMDIPKVERAHYKLLDSVLGEALAGYSPKTISIAVSGLPPAPPPIPPAPTEAEKLDAEILGKVDCAETLMNRLQWIKENKPDVASVFLTGKRSIAREIEDLKDEEFKGLEDTLKHKVNGLFHDPNRVR